MSMPPKTGTAAVAIIRNFAPHETFLILRRATHPDDPWSGHFSFPGGRKERVDKNLLDTCIRETREETGILLSKNQLDKALPLEPAGRNFSNPLWVQPYIFNLPTIPTIKLDEKEIQGSCWLDVQEFKTKTLHQQVEMLPGQFFPAYSLQDYFLWGFTYRLLLTILQMKS